MSEPSEVNQELLESWVLVDDFFLPTENVTDSVIEELPNLQRNETAESSGDSESDSISVISEGNSSYKSDDEELVTTFISKKTENVLKAEEDEKTKEVGETEEIGTAESTNPTIANTENEAAKPVSNPEIKLEVDSPANDPEPTPEVDSPVSHPESRPEINSPAGDLQPTPEIDSPASDPEPKIVESFLTEGSSQYFKKLFPFVTSLICTVLVIYFAIALQRYFSSQQNVLNTDEIIERDGVCLRSHCFVGDDTAGPSGIIKPKEFPRKREFSKQISQPNFEEEPQNKLNKEHSIFTPKQDIHNRKIAESFTYCQRFRRNKDQGKQNNNQPDQTNKIRLEEHPQEQDENVVNGNYNKKVEELKIKEEYLREKEKFLIRKEHDLLQQEIKLKKFKNRDKTEEDENETITEFEEIQKKCKGKKKCKFLFKDKPEKKHKKHKKENKKSKNENETRSSKKRYINGEWYLDLHKARSDIRQKEHASDWVFDRALIRSLKRNKAYWYFQWMFDRERLRVKT